MKLLILEPDPSFGGGSEAVMLSLSQELAARGHRIVLLHEKAGTMLADYRACTEEQVQARLPGFAVRAPLRTIASVLRVGRVARSHDVDAIVSSHLGFIQHAAVIRRLFGVPSCFHLGLSLVDPPRSLRYAIGHAGTGVAPSAHSLESWKAGGWDSGALHLVPNWISPDRFAPAPHREQLRSDCGMVASARHIVFVGRICRQKGVDVLLGAFARVAETREDVHLHLIGPISPEFQSVLDAATAGMADAVRARVRALPATAHPERFYAAADLVCAPSAGDEAFGLTVLEAMACAVPVVATSIGIVPQILGEDAAGMVAAPGDASALAERLAWWIDRPELQASTGVRLRRRALDAYGPATSIDRYEAILTDIARTTRTDTARDA